MSLRVLIPGRFQPFHKGHFQNVVKMIELGHIPIIAIRDVPISKKDPWPPEIICKIIEYTVGKEQLDKVQVCVVPDLCDDWPIKLTEVVGEFDAVAAGNPRLKHFFKHTHHKIIHTPRKDNSYSSTSVRRQLKLKESIADMCLSSTIEIMKDMGLIHETN